MDSTAFVALAVPQPPQLEQPRPLPHPPCLASSGCIQRPIARRTTLRRDCPSTLAILDWQRRNGPGATWRKASTALLETIMATSKVCSHCVFMR